MKRHWRVSRIIAAALLLSLAALAVYFWPLQPRWKMPAEQLVGFDMQRGLLWTIWEEPLPDVQSRHFELHGLDLLTGNRNGCMPITLPRHGETLPPPWHFTLSTDLNTLACWQSWQGAPSIRLIDLQKQNQRTCSTTSDSFIFGLALSSNGDKCAIRVSDTVEVWDCSTETLLQTLEMPDGTTSPGGTGSFSEEKMQFSPDDRYLIANGGSDKIVVFDLRSGDAIGVCPNSSFALFLSDNISILALPYMHSLNDTASLRLDLAYPRNLVDKIVGYRIQYSEITPINNLGVGKAVVLDAVTSRIVLGIWEVKDKMSLPDWIPAVIRRWIEGKMGTKMETVRIESWDASTFQLRDTFNVQLLGLQDVKVSPDGQWLALQESDQLSLWHIPPHPSHFRWLVCCILAVMAMCLAWPRR